MSDTVNDPELLAGFFEESSVEQINTAVAQMDKVTQENAANAEQSAASSAEMQGQATHLQNAVGDLQRVVNGGSGSAARSSGASASEEEPTASLVSPLRRPMQVAAAPAKRTTNGRLNAAAKPSQMLPLTDEEAADRSGDFSRF